MIYDIEDPPPEADLLHPSNLPRTPRRSRPTPNLAPDEFVRLVRGEHEPRSFSGARQVAVWVDPHAAMRAITQARHHAAVADRWVRRREAELFASQFAADKLRAIAVRDLDEVTCLKRDKHRAFQGYLEARRELRRAQGSYAPHSERVQGLRPRTSLAWAAVCQAHRLVADASTRHTTMTARLNAARVELARSSAAYTAALEREITCEERLERARGLASGAAWAARHPVLPMFHVGRTGRQGVLAASVFLPAPAAEQARAAGQWRPDIARLGNVRLTG